MLETSGQQLASILTSLHLLSYDVLIIAALLVVCTVITFRYGKERVIALILALYIALLAFIHFPYKEQFIFFSATETQVLISTALIFFAFLAVSYTAVAPLLHNRFLGRTKHRVFEAVLLGVALTTLLIAFSYHVLPIASFYSFGDSIAEWFAPSQFFFWWLVVPVGVLFIISRR